MTDRYRFLVVSPPYVPLPPEGYGGIEKVVVERTGALSALGHTVDVVAPTGSAVPGARRVYHTRRIGLTEMRYTGNLLADFPRFIVFSRSFGYLKAYTELGEISSEYDCVVNDAFRSEPWTLLLLTAQLGWGRTIGILHGNMPRWSSRRPISRLRQLQFGALNTHCADFLVRNGWRVFHTPNGITFPSPTQVVTDPDRRLVFVGRITREKGVHQAIRLAKLVKVPISIFGKVQDFGYFKREIEPTLVNGEAEYLGNRPRAELDDAIRHSAGLVFTSMYDDPYPAVLLEALRFGVPVIGTPAGWYSGFHDVCDESNSLVRGTVDELAQSFDRVARFDRTQIFEASRARFSWESVLESTLLPTVARVVSEKTHV
jgi:glycosyltransferase involved in cell wall biosynthesis